MKPAGDIRLRGCLQLRASQAENARLRTEMQSIIEQRNSSRLATPEEKSSGASGKVKEDRPVGRQELPTKEDGPAGRQELSTKEDGPAGQQNCSPRRMGQ